MKKYALIFISLMICSISAQAALPPAYQSAKEFRAVLDSPKLIEIIGSAEPIESIIRENNGFLIKTNKHTLRVDVVYETMDHPGPAKFHLAFHELEPLQK